MEILPINKNTNYNQDFFTKSMVQLIKSLKIKNIILAGESIGGVLPVTISLIIPKLIKKIILLIHMIMIHILVKALEEEIFLQNL